MAGSKDHGSSEQLRGRDRLKAAWKTIDRYIDDNKISFKKIKGVFPLSTGRVLDIRDPEKFLENLLTAFENIENFGNGMIFRGKPKKEVSAVIDAAVKEMVIAHAEYYSLENGKNEPGSGRGQDGNGGRGR